MTQRDKEGRPGSFGESGQYQSHEREHEWGHQQNTGSGRQGSPSHYGYGQEDMGGTGAGRYGMGSESGSRSYGTQGGYGQGSQGQWSQGDQGGYGSYGGSGGQRQQPTGLGAQGGYGDYPGRQTGMGQQGNYGAQRSDYQSGYGIQGMGQQGGYSGEYDSQRGPQHYGSGQRDYGQHPQASRGDYYGTNPRGSWDSQSYGADTPSPSAQGGQTASPHPHDVDYHQWRTEQMRNLDEDYQSWRKERYQKFADEFNAWRGNRPGRTGSQGGQQSGNLSAGQSSSQSNSQTGGMPQSTANQSGPSSSTSNLTGVGLNASSSENETFAAGGNPLVREQDLANKPESEKKNK